MECGQTAIWVQHICKNNSNNNNKQVNSKTIEVAAAKWKKSKEKNYNKNKTTAVYSLKLPPETSKRLLLVGLASIALASWRWNLLVHTTERAGNIICRSNVGTINGNMKKKSRRQIEKLLLLLFVWCEHAQIPTTNTTQQWGIKRDFFLPPLWNEHAHEYKSMGVCEEMII